MKEEEEKEDVTNHSIHHSKIENMEKKNNETNEQFWKRMARNGKRRTQYYAKKHGLSFNEAERQLTEKAEHEAQSEPDDDESDLQY